jgi:hypothetical protein
MAVIGGIDQYLSSDLHAHRRYMARRRRRQERRG